MHARGFGPLAFLAAVLVAAPAFAQSGKTLRIVVPYPAGAYYDFVARVMGQKLGEQTGETVIVENRVGANGIVGTEYVARSAPDGQTLLLGGIGPNAINASLYPKLPYNPITDFAPVMHIANMPNVLVVHPGVEARTVAELVALAKAKPGTLNVASAGSGSSPHLAAAMFATATGIDINHVPFKGSAPAVAAMLAGQTQLTFGPVGDVLPQIRAGKLRALASTTARRVGSMPDVPTMAEAGVQGVEAVGWSAFFAPAATPAEAVTRLNAGFNKVLQAPDVREKLSVQGSAEIIGGTPEQLATFLRADIARWAQVVKAAKVSAD